MREYFSPSLYLPTSYFSFWILLRFHFFQGDNIAFFSISWHLPCCESPTSRDTKGSWFAPYKWYPALFDKCSRKRPQSTRLMRTTKGVGWGKKSCMLQIPTSVCYTREVLRRPPVRAILPEKGLEMWITGRLKEIQLPFCKRDPRRWNWKLISSMRVL